MSLILKEKTLRETAGAIAEAEHEMSIFTIIENIYDNYFEINPNVLNRMFDTLHRMDGYDVSEDAKRFYDHNNVDESVAKPKLIDYKDAPNPSLRFGKMFTEYMILFDELHGHTLRSPNRELPPFNSGWEKDKLIKLYHYLIEHEFIVDVSEENFVNIFSGAAKDNITERIKWKVTYQGKFNDNKAMFTLFFCILKFDNARFYIEEDKQLIILTILKNFIPAKKHDFFEYGSLKKAMGRYRDRIVEYKKGKLEKLDPESLELIEFVKGLL